MTKISVVTVCYNSADTLEATLQSVAAQSHDAVEHVVVDGGSTDGTVEILARWKDRLAVVVSEPDRGLYDAMNKGIGLATGDVIATLNADDLYADADVLRDVAAVFDADPGVQATYGDLLYVRRDDVNAVVRVWRSGRPGPRGIARGWHPPHPTFMVRREVYARCGLFRLDYKLAADIELLVRFTGKCRVPLHYIPRVLVRMRMGGVSNRRVSTVIAQNRWVLTAYRDNGIARSPLLMLYKLVDRLRQYARAGRMARHGR